MLTLRMIHTDGSEKIIIQKQVWKKLKLVIKSADLLNFQMESWELCHQY